MDNIKEQFTQKGRINFGHIDYLFLLREGYVSKEFDESAFKFTFVRNPYDRAVALFFHEHKWRRTWIWPFLAFCKKVEAGFDPIGPYSNLRNPIWNPQTSWLDGIKLDFVGRYETLQEDFEALCNTLGIEVPSLKRRSWIRHKPYPEYYCEETIAIVNKIYQADFTKLGYSMSTILL